MEFSEQKVKALQDYPALKKLAGVLWRQDSSYRGAAVMVGAGFSRCAAQRYASGQVIYPTPQSPDMVST